MLEDDATFNSKTKIMQGFETVVQAPTRLQTAGQVQHTTNAANFTRIALISILLSSRLAVGSQKAPNAFQRVGIREHAIVFAFRQQRVCNPILWRHMIIVCHK